MHIFALTLLISLVALLGFDLLQHLIIAGSSIALGIGIYMIAPEMFQAPKWLKNLIDSKPIPWWWNLFNAWLAGTVMFMVDWNLAGFAYTFSMVFMNHAHIDWHKERKVPVEKWINAREES